MAIGTIGLAVAVIHALVEALITPDAAGTSPVDAVRSE